MGDKDGFNNPFAALKGLGRDLPKQEKKAAVGEPAPEAEGPPMLSGKITLRREKKGRGGKTVTRVIGLPSARLEEFCQRMKKGLGCGAKVEGDDVVLLGALTERGAEWLRAEGARQVIIGN